MAAVMVLFEVTIKKEKQRLSCKSGTAESLFSACAGADPVRALLFPVHGGKAPQPVGVGERGKRFSMAQPSGPPAEPAIRQSRRFYVVSDHGSYSDALLYNAGARGGTV